MKKLRQLVENGERGAALMWVAGSLVALLAVSAFAIDLGWYYLNSARLQRAADSAALAGVVHLPAFPTLALNDAVTAATANAFGGATVTDAMLADNKYQVTLDVTVPTFFARIVGINSLPLQRKATAEYVKPVALGSPSRCFGQDPLGTYCPSGGKYWAAVNAPYTLKRDGDPYSTNCVDNGGSYTSCSSNNPDYAHAGSYVGYYYAIDVPTGASNIRARLFDAGWYDRPNYPTVETADEKYSPGSAGNPGITMNFRLYSPDSTPGDPTDNSNLVCSLTLNPEQSSATYKWRWNSSWCASNLNTPGIWVLHTYASGTGSGTNQFSLAASSSSGPQPRVYGINEISIFSNGLTGAAPGDRLDLAEIPLIHAGKRLELKFFDAGDASGASWIRVKMPNGTIPNCTWNSVNEAGTQTASGSGPCEWQTTLANGTKVFDSQWLNAYIDIPDAGTYTCPVDCFWWMELQLTQPNERTTWTARVIGNPVRLVPNP